MEYDYLIVGAGFAGCVLAERLATQLNKKVLVIDRRKHIGGNAYDSIDKHGIRIHHYGPHVFHTNDEEVFRYLSTFTAWHPYQHKVGAYVDGKLVPMPINRTTINQVLGTQFTTDDEVKKFYNREREAIVEINNSEDVVISKVGRKLYDLLYKGYTTKHWGIDPSHLSPSVCARLPVRVNTDDRYFEDRFQAMPLHGFTVMFQRMLSHQNISIEAGVDFADVPTRRYDRLIFTGPIDEYFNYVHGKLPYRSLRFEFETHDVEFYQPVAQVNYPNDFDYTRITEFKHITGQKNRRTTIAKEFSLDEGEPFYPIPNDDNVRMHRRYVAEAKKLASVRFAGRLATYRYYNMDQVTAQALKLFEEIAGEK